MKSLLIDLRNVAVSGFFFLLPVIIVLVIITKAWTALTSVGARLAGVFGMTSIVGMHGTSVITGVLLVAVCITCGLLVRLPFMSVISNAVEGWVSRIFPGYAMYKAMAEEKLQAKARVVPYVPALLRRHECWIPAYVVEQDQEGTCVVFLPQAPDTGKGQVVLAGYDQLRIVSSVTANQLDALLKNTGKGLIGSLSGGPADRPR